MGKSQEGKTYINPYKLFVGCFIPNWLVARPEISFGAKVMYAILSQHAGPKGYCWPGQEVLSQEMGITERQARSLIEELKKYELIAVNRRGQGRSSQYYFLEHPWFALLDRKDTSSQDRKDISSPNKEKIKGKDKKEERPDRTGSASPKGPSRPVSKDEQNKAALRGYREKNGLSP